MDTMVDACQAAIAWSVLDPLKGPMNLALKISVVARFPDLRTPGRTAII